MGTKFIVELIDEFSNGAWISKNLAVKKVTPYPEGIVNISDELYMTTRQAEHLVKILKIFGVDYTIDTFEVSTLPIRKVTVSYRYCPMPSCTDNSLSENKIEEGN